MILKSCIKYEKYLYLRILISGKWQHNFLKLNGKVGLNLKRHQKKYRPRTLELLAFNYQFIPQKKAEVSKRHYLSKANSSKIHYFKPPTGTVHTHLTIYRHRMQPTVFLATAKSRTLESLAFDEYCHFDTSAWSYWIKRASLYPLPR